MVLNQVDNVIGTREFDNVDGGKVIVLIGKPELFPKGEAIAGYFYCPFQITGIGDDTVMYSPGIDSMEAITAALRLVGSFLHTSKPASEGKLKWKGARADDKLGLPNPVVKPL